MFNSTSMAENLQHFLQELPRYSFSFTSVSNDWAPISLSYYESLILISAPFLLLGLLSVIFGIIFVTCGLCCVCIWPRQKHGYSLFERAWPAASVVVLVACIGVTMVIGIYSEVVFNNSFIGSLNTLEETLDYEISLTNNTINNATAYVEDKAFGFQNISYAFNTSTISEWENELSGVVNNVTTFAYNVIAGVELARHIVILFVFSVIVVVCVFGAIGSIMLWGWTALLIIILSLLCISMAWILSSFNLFMSVFIADMCPELEMNSGIVSQYVPVSLEQYVDYFLFCKESGVDPITLFYPIPQILNETMTHLNEAIAASNGSDKYLQESQVALTELIHAVESLLDCEMTANAYDQIRSSTCVQLFDGLFAITTTEIIAGFLLLVVIFVSVFGLRRWPNPKRDKDEQMDRFAEDTPLIVIN